MNGCKFLIAFTLASVSAFPRKDMWYDLRACNMTRIEAFAAIACRNALSPDAFSANSQKDSAPEAAAAVNMFSANSKRAKQHESSSLQMRKRMGTDTAASNSFSTVFVFCVTRASAMVLYHVITRA